jgi:hypothetical protein
LRTCLKKKKERCDIFIIKACVGNGLGSGGFGIDLDVRGDR